MHSTSRMMCGARTAIGAAAILATIVLAACSAGNTAASAPGASTSGGANTVPATHSADVAKTQSAAEPPSRDYRIDSGVVSLTNSLNGEKIEISVTKIVDPAVPRPGSGTPDPGDRFVAVQYEIRNVGTLPYGSDTAQMAAILADRESQQFKPVFVQPDTSAGPNLPGTFNVVPGQKLRGNVVFELPDASLPGQVQWNMGMGFGGTALWNITGGK